MKTQYVTLTLLQDDTTEDTYKYNTRNIQCEALQHILDYQQLQDGHNGE
jgi:hypothetical protein